MAISQPSLRPADVVVALRLAVSPEEKYEAMASVLGLGLGAAHRSVQRLRDAALLVRGSRMVNGAHLLEFLTSGIRYVFYPVIGPEAPGVPTAYSAPPLSGEFVSDRAMVWASVQGRVRGETLVPLYDGAPNLVKTAPRVYELLTLVDALRAGHARERKRAAELLEAVLRDRRGGE